MARYVNFVTWREDAVERGAKVRKVAVTNFNTYWRAVKDGVVIGFFNTCVGKRGRKPTDAPGGKLVSMVKETTHAANQ